MVILHGINVYLQIPQYLHFTFARSFQKIFMSQALNNIPCGGIGNTADGCTEIFPRAPPGLLCQKCQKVKAAGTVAQQVELKKARNSPLHPCGPSNSSPPQSLKSCQDCGVCGSMIENKLCGTCRRLGNLNLVVPQQCSDFRFSL